MQKTKEKKGKRLLQKPGQGLCRKFAETGRGMEETVLHPVISKGRQGTDDSGKVGRVFQKLPLIAKEASVVRKKVRKHLGEEVPSRKDRQVLLLPPELLEEEKIGTPESVQGLVLGKRSNGEKAFEVIVEDVLLRLVVPVEAGFADSRLQKELLDGDVLEIPSFQKKKEGFH